MHNAERCFFIPEVIQSSALDCGPAVIKALLSGFNIDANYENLREHCHTDIDGTSIEALESILIEFGLNATQLLTPKEHFLLPEAEVLPAIAVVVQPNGMPHFIVVWRIVSGWAQIMDPGTGRHWITLKSLQERLYTHQQLIDESAWQQWVTSGEFSQLLKVRMLTICNDADWAQSCIDIALQSDDWQSITKLDAATTMIMKVIRSGAIKPGEQAALLLNHSYQTPELISPDNYIAEPEDEGTIYMSGVVIIHVAGKQSSTTPRSNEPSNEDEKAKFDEQSVTPERTIYRALMEDGLLHPMVLFVGILLASFGLALEVIVLRGLVEVSQQISLFSQKLEIMHFVLLFFFALLILEWPLAVTSRAIGRRIEVRIRQRFLEKLPKLGERYFSSRLSSDMIQRAYELRQLRNIPVLGFNVIKITLQIVFITIGLAVLFPQGTVIIAFSCIAILACTFATQPLMQEQDLTFRTHISGLSNFYLDALRGLKTIRSHSSGTAVRIEHERLLVNWMKAGWRFCASYEHVALFNFLIGSALTVWVVLSYVDFGGDASGLLVLLYWMLYLPQLGGMLAENVQQYPSLRNRLIRALEPLSVPDENTNWYPQTSNSEEKAHKKQKLPKGAKIKLNNIDLELTGQRVLSNWNVCIEPSEHIAIVGQSGSGKSSLAGLLLGLYKPANGGTLIIDGSLYQGEQISKLHQEMVWIAPEVQMWNQSIAANIKYGNDSQRDVAPAVYEQAELIDILNQLSDEQSDALGECGGLLSGGEGQRVRIARGFNKQSPRLVIMDEPFRGLPKAQRQRLLHKAQLLWKDATVIIISHHIEDTKDFKRVWVVDDGQLVEDDSPTALLSDANSLYTQLFQEQGNAQRDIWHSTKFKRLRLENGKLLED
ncbi:MULTISPECIES: ATP-binding cassette domain-containing protein [Pseudoalteromonas]|uniref:ABC transporter ATP-binding protein n=1 Tax=Pseudoalteromonas amylolytica TaxID=1859457 RepID=A0A1S1MSR6_9GAMM|nr:MULTISPECIES: ATP-binding cassette domain-containing protein [Pseudoalteromonas]OHU85147.1 hypothetical protein BFC16_20975 [Pseudoalteromonas sp. JW3]OHU89902.1 hypothetical protein BET10_14000 [Pseudoalteromonas amylolytica]